MRYLLSFSLAAVLACSGHAANQIINVTPQTLDGWAVTGTDKSSLASTDQLVLPAGVQLSREFSGSAIILHLVTQPVFSNQTADWPIVGLGSAALAFTRIDGQRQMVLVVDENTATVLPWSLPLDPSGKLGPVELYLAYDPGSGVGLISYQDQIKSFNLSPNAKSAEVWLSAGTPSNWPLDVMQVILFDPNAIGTGTDTNPGSASSKPTPPDNLQAVLDQMQATTNAAAAAAAVALGGGNTAAKASKVSRLEVFTPPSVRRVQVVNAVRNAVAKALTK